MPIVPNNIEHYSIANSGNKQGSTKSNSEGNKLKFNAYIIAYKKLIVVWFILRYMAVTWIKLLHIIPGIILDLVIVAFHCIWHGNIQSDSPIPKKWHPNNQANLTMYYHPSYTGHNKDGLVCKIAINLQKLHTFKKRTHFSEEWRRGRMTV